MGLQCVEIDAVSTQGLSSGRAVAQARRKELTRRADGLAQRIAQAAKTWSALTVGPDAGSELKQGWLGVSECLHTSAVRGPASVASSCRRWCALSGGRFISLRDDAGGAGAPSGIERSIALRGARVGASTTGDTQLRLETAEGLTVHLIADTVEHAEAWNAAIQTNIDVAGRGAGT